MTWMSNTWTEEQQQVITLRDRDILVSAAAGSGKTAVLVERIIQKVCDETNPVDIDQMLVVTFTNAAAAEMRERIRGAIEEAQEKNPENPHLLRQLTLVHNAQITTIHSFCLYVIRNHFQEIGLDPEFRLGDEGEMKLLRQKVLDTLLEEQYAQGREAFLNLVSTYAKGSRDQEIVDMIEQLYHVAISYPWPRKWLQQAVKGYQVQSEEELRHTLWMQEMIQEVLTDIKDMREETSQLLEITNRPDGPACYRKSLSADIEMYHQFLSETDYEILQDLFAHMKYATIGNSRGYTGDPELLDEVKGKREDIKGRMKKLKEDYFAQTLSEIYEKLKAIAPFAGELVELTDLYMERLTQEKRQHNLLDFNDLEHLALEILVDEETGNSTEAALEFAQHFQEIMIDEYQDSNYIQETLLRSISKEPFGGHNFFMVGDVKQSIYRFRLARPEIFMGKYQQFSTTDGPQQRIDLHMNFRSRHEVLDFCNDIFYKTMQKDLGNVAYDDVAALYTGAKDYPDAGDSYIPEILVGDSSSELLEEQYIEDAASYEAKLVADKIHQLMQDLPVTDKAEHILRPLRYSDIVILLRSPGTMGQAFVDVLTENGIPAHMTSITGYFDTMEVRTVLNMLQVIDNPYQDIPLAAVLHSKMFDFTNDDMARIRMVSQESTFAEAFFQYGKFVQEQENSEQKLGEKVGYFMDFLGEMRELSMDTPIHEMIEIVLKRTGFLTYVTAMPSGANRKANLEKLVDQAIAYESTSYQGLFHFVNYIGRLQKYEVDFGGAELVSENDDAVRIMSIHKSKGLEFPVVFVSGMGKQINKKDSQGKMVLHPEYGIALDYIDGIRRVKSNTLYKRIVQHAVGKESLGEELRVLYVALTRAKEKLILTGTMKKAADTIRKMQPAGKTLSYTKRSTAGTYFDWVIPAIKSYPDKYSITIVGMEAMVDQEITQATHVLGKEEVLKQLVQQADENICQNISQRLEYQYPYPGEGEYKSKYSVSEIKHLAMEKAYADEQSAPMFVTRKENAIVPEFIRHGKEENQGALRGTAVHRFLECYEFTRLITGKDSFLTGEALQLDVTGQLKEMLAGGKITAEQKQLLLVKKLVHFLESETAHRMAKAAQREQLFLERAFVIGDAPEAFFTEERGDMQKPLSLQDMILVQGIIDVFWQEEDGIVVLDYKTDKVSAREELVKRYQRQLQLYGESLERICHEPVKEKIIYSFALEETIEL